MNTNMASTSCPLQVVDCPNLEGGCHSCCPKRMNRCDIDKHVQDPVVLAFCLQLSRFVVIIIIIIIEEIIILFILYYYYYHYYFDKLIIIRSENVRLQQEINNLKEDLQNEIRELRNYIYQNNNNNNNNN